MTQDKKQQDKKEYLEKQVTAMDEMIDLFESAEPGERNTYKDIIKRNKKKTEQDLEKLKKKNK